MYNKKSDIELELARKCRELRESFEFNNKLEKRVLELEKRVDEMERRLFMHVRVDSPMA